MSRLRAPTVQKAAYKIKTPYYSLTVPKAWRGKVVWTTTSAYAKQYKMYRSGQYGYRQVYTGKSRKIYHTTFYLKGHKGDNRYWLATIGGAAQRLRSYDRLG